MRRRKQKNQKQRQESWYQKNSISRFIFSERRQVNGCPQGNFGIT